MAWESAVVRFAAFTTVAASAGEATGTAGLLDNLRQQTILAEQLGFEAMWLGEHHFGPYGVGDIPNPILLGADLAARTSRIRIGQMANIAPWWHPIRLAEDLAILDNLSGGRADVGFGRGVWPYEGPQFHPHADPRRDRENWLRRPARRCWQSWRSFVSRRCVCTGLATAPGRRYLTGPMWPGCGWVTR